MGLLKRLLGKANSADKRAVNDLSAGRSEADRQTRLEPARMYDGRDELDCVGEATYQAVLERFAGGRTYDGVDVEVTAQLVPEPGNPYDANAVCVRVGNQTVGYLRRDEAAMLQPRIIDVMRRTQRGVAVRGRIVGGWDRGPHDRGHFGLRLRYDANAFGLPAKTYTGRTKQRYLRSVIANEIGMVNGRHHSAWHDEAKQLRREGRYIDAEQLLLTIVNATEAESRTDGIGVAPSAYEQLAILYRKRKTSMRNIRALRSAEACARGSAAKVAGTLRESLSIAG